LTDGRACPFAVRLFYATVFVAPICTVVSADVPALSTESCLSCMYTVSTGRTTGWGRAVSTAGWLGPNREHWLTGWGRTMSTSRPLRPGREHCRPAGAEP